MTWRVSEINHVQSTAPDAVARPRARSRTSSGSSPARILHRSATRSTSCKSLAARRGASREQLGQILRKIPCFEVMNQEALEIIEQNADTVLEEVGLEFRVIVRPVEVAERDEDEPQRRLGFVRSDRLGGRGEDGLHDGRRG